MSVHAGWGSRARVAYVLAILGGAVLAVLAVLCFSRPSVELWLLNVVAASAVWTLIGARRRSLSGVDPLLFAVAYMPTLASLFGWIDLIGWGR
jgi:hypothetical protein